MKGANGEDREKGKRPEEAEAVRPEEEVTGMVEDPTGPIEEEESDGFDAMFEY